jgi:hypothetical protein
MRGGPHRATHATAGWLFRRLLGVVYLAAFASLAVQLRGLIGESGILPAREYMANAARWTDSPIERLMLWPTLGWVGTADGWLVGLCLAGVAMGAALVAGWVPVILLPLLWLDYLSLAVLGRDFFAYQWDALLLETGFLAIFLAPAVRCDRFRDRSDPPRSVVWLVTWLIFRLMMGSGLAKLASGDPTWAGLTAMAFHFETQPLPTPIAWYAHHLPVWFNRFTTMSVLALELVAPLFLFAGSRLRHLAAWLFIGLQILIALTGNYTFFNLLTASLALLLLDDAALGRIGGRFGPLRSREGATGGMPAVHGRVRRVAVIALAVVTLPLSFQALGRSAGFSFGSAGLADLAERLSSFRIVNSYGLFAAMTTSRPEIVVEGSEDGNEWKPYEFRYKPGDPMRRPPWVAPHQPRLDWQMWFAALGELEGERWFVRFERRLLEASPAVLGLLAHDPFAGRPPRYVRAILYDYRFTKPGGEPKGAWWTRTELGDYAPVMAAP